MNHSRFGEPVVSLIEQKFKHTSTGELVSQGQALDKTRDLLNEVMYESTMKKELEEIRCTEFENRQFALLKQTENDIAAFNSQELEGELSEHSTALALGSKDNTEAQ